MKNVKIITGMFTSKRYLGVLKKQYKSHNFNVEVISNHWTLLTHPFIHKYLYQKYDKIINKNDLIHVLSGANFSIIPYISNKKNFLVSDSVLYNFETVTNVTFHVFNPKKYTSYKDNVEKKSGIFKYKIVKKYLDFVFFPEYKKIYISSLHYLIKQKRIVLIHSKNDNCASYNGFEKIIKDNGALFDNGKHSTLFDIKENRFFFYDIIKKYENHLDK